MTALKKLLALSICFYASLYGDWDVSVLQNTSNSEHILHSPDYINLKSQVKKGLEKSWCSVEKIDLLMDLTALTQPNVCVEIGAFTGSSVLPVAAVLKHLNSGKIFAIDAWSNTVAVQYLANEDPNKQWWSQVDMRSAFKGFQEVKQKWSLGNFCKEIPKPSELAIYDIPGEIDFLNLDGDYSETGSLRDVELYLPKVKSGGYVLLSNLYIMVNREQPKIKSFCSLFESCELVCSIEKDNAVLFRKR